MLKNPRNLSQAKEQTLDFYKYLITEHKKDLLKIL